MNNLGNYTLFSLNCFFVTFFVRYFLIKKNFLLDNYNFSAHKNINNKSLNFGPPLCGGLIIFIISLFAFNFIYLSFFILFMLIIGILSDVNILTSPTIRILLQIAVVIPFVYFFDLRILDLRINTLDKILQINFISILFVSFCILVLINGTNFIDGLNTLVLGYYVIVLAIIIFISSKFNLFLNKTAILFLILLLTLFIFNFFQKLFLGDSGSYITALVISFYLLDFKIKNNFISPYFICLLLWYPAFENLFSILRRVFCKKKTSEADRMHLHQFLYYFVSKKTRLNLVVSNTLSAIILNLFNLLILITSISFFHNTKMLIILILFSVVLYLLTYFSLRKFYLLKFKF
jgi:UDP-N-acetylmuramyl pentapeptide phosphotransferase/UDP-N-acetylglucosamine-1-phosphate transferase